MLADTNVQHSANPREREGGFQNRREKKKKKENGEKEHQREVNQQESTVRVEEGVSE